MYLHIIDFTLNYGTHYFDHDIYVNFGINQEEIEREIIYFTSFVENV